MEQILTDGAKALGLSLNSQAISDFEIYFKYLQETNEVMNLTAISEPDEVAKKHFLDSLCLTLAGDFKNATAIDIGSGAGFPGMPLKIAEPSLKLTLLDSRGKRVAFLENLCDKLGVSGVSCVAARAEETALLTDYRDSFDYALSRAVARLNVLCELCMPFVKVNGVFLSMKSSQSEEEIREAVPAIEKLGGRLEPSVDYLIPGSELQHRIVVIKKIAPTPEGYPRRFGRIEKKPL